VWAYVCVCKRGLFKRKQSGGGSWRSSGLQSAPEMGTEKLETGYGKESGEAGFEHENALSVLATAGEIDMARSTPSQSPANRKSNYLPSPLKYWHEVALILPRLGSNFDGF